MKELLYFSFWIPGAHFSGGSRGGGGGGCLAPPYFRPKWSSKGRKKFLRPSKISWNTIKPGKDHCVLPHYLRTNKSLSTKRFPINHVTRNWQEQDLTTVSLWQNVPKCEQKILYSPGSTLRNMKHARNRESVRQTWEVEVLLLNGWEWLQHLEYPSLKQEGEGAWQGAQKILWTQVCPCRFFYFLCCFQY